MLLQENRSPTALLVLLAVIVFHELGHYVGMRAFGYTDVRSVYLAERSRSPCSPRAER